MAVNMVLVFANQGSVPSTAEANTRLSTGLANSGLGLIAGSLFTCK